MAIFELPKVQFYHLEAPAHVNSFIPGGKSREIICLGKEPRAHLRAKVTQSRIARKWCLTAYM